MSKREQKADHRPAIHRTNPGFPTGRSASGALVFHGVLGFNPEFAKDAWKEIKQATFRSVVL